MMNPPSVLFITHKATQCGVYEFWSNIVQVLKQSKKYTFIHIECDRIGELNSAILKYNPEAIIYNFHPGIMPWLTASALRLIHKSRIAHMSIPQIGIIHEVTAPIIEASSNMKQSWIFWLRRHLVNHLFDFYIAPDPTLITEKKNIFTTGRLVPEYENVFPLPEVPTFWSFWFATWNKWFEEIVKKVQEEFDTAHIRFNIPFARFWDESWMNALRIAESCKSILYKKWIQLTITHDFLKQKEMLDFLAKNTVNIFLYQSPPKEARGISSVIENALAVERPICISRSSMFRHIHNTFPSVKIDDTSLSEIIAYWFTPLEKYKKAWTARNLLQEYETILDSII